MPHLWFIVTLLGHTAAIYGPLPYGMTECQHRLTEQTKVFRTAVTTHPGFKYKAEDFKFYCTSTNQPPKLEEVYPAKVAPAD